MAEKKSVSVKVYNQAGEEVSKLSLDAKVFGVEPNNQAMFDAVQVYQANSRQGTAKTKVRHEVSGGGKKPWRQKGTGRARAGSTRSPIWVGGGTVFGPVGNQNWKISQNKEEHRVALRSALSLKVKDGLVVIDEFKFDEIKTKKFVEVLENLNLDSAKVLVVDEELSDNLVKSANNVGFVKLVAPCNVSVYDLLNADGLLITKGAIKKLEEALK